MGAGSVFKADTKRSGWVYALDGGSGKVAWSYHAGSPVLSGVTPTAGGIVFSGESSGNVLALDAHSGALLNSLSMGGSLGGGVVTYAVRGTQYVATTAGNVSRAGLSSAGDVRPRLIIMSVGTDPGAPPRRTWSLIRPRSRAVSASAPIRARSLTTSSAPVATASAAEEAEPLPRSSMKAAVRASRRSRSGYGILRRPCPSCLRPSCRARSKR